MKRNLHQFKLNYEDLKFKIGYTIPKAPVRSNVSSAGAFVLTYKHIRDRILTRLLRIVRKELTVNKKKLGLYFDIAVGTIVILINELAAFLYIRDHISQQPTAYMVAGFAVFTSSYIVFKLISRLIK